MAWQAIVQSLLLRGFNVPSALNATFDALISGALVGIRRQRSIHFLATPLRNLESVMKTNAGNLQHTVDLLNIAFDIRHEILSRLDVPHIQCGPEGAEQSSGNAGNHMIKRGRILGASDLATILLLVEVLDTTMNAEVKGFVKSLDPCRPVRSFVFGNLDSASVGD